MEMDMVRLCYCEGDTVMDKDLVQRRFIIKGLLAQGVTILGGYPKSGKSWLVLDWAIRVARGQPVWGMEVTQGTVLYMCLEDTEDRLRHRLSLMTDEVPKNLCLSTAVGTLATTFEQQIDFFMRERPDTVLIIVDTFQVIRTASNDPSYGGDYEDVKRLKDMADKYGIALLLVHHLRKQNDTDPFKLLSGTTGLTGAADNLFVLARPERGSNVGRFHGTGRDIADRLMNLMFSREKYVWEVVSDSLEEPEVRLPAELRALIKYMEEVKHYCGGNQELCQRLKDQTGVAATPKGLKQKMNVWRHDLAEMGLTYESRKTNGERIVELHFEVKET